MLLHLIHHLLQLLLILRLLFSGIRHQALMIGDQLLEHIDLRLEVPYLLLIIGRILLARLHNLLDALSLHLHTVKIFVGAE